MHTHTHTHKQTGIHTHKQTGIHKKVHLALRVGRHLALSVGRHLALSVGRGKGGDKAQGWSSLLAARMGLPTRQTGTTNTCMNKICIHTHTNRQVYTKRCI